MPFLLKNGPNSNKVGKGHILPLRLGWARRVVYDGALSDVYRPLAERRMFPPSRGRSGSVNVWEQGWNERGA